MVTTGAISISKIMMVNHSLQQLYISNNDIGDDGIFTIAGSLGDCKISSLSVNNCGITLTGTRLLATVVSCHHTIRDLWLLDNHITVEGALLIVNSAVYNTVCEEVWIDDEYDKNDEILNLKKILFDRKRQEVKDFAI